MRTFSFFNIFLISTFIACQHNDDEVIPEFSSLECTIYHTGYTGDELQAEVGYYESLSVEPAEVIVSFYRVTETIDDWWEVVAPTKAFSIVSWKVVEDDWVDMYGNPLNEVVFAIDLSGATIASDITSFFNDSGVTELEDGEDVWFHIWSPSETSGMESLNMYLFAYGYEEDDGFCALIE